MVTRTLVALALLLGGLPAQMEGFAVSVDVTVFEHVPSGTFDITAEWTPPTADPEMFAPNSVDYFITGGPFYTSSQSFPAGTWTEPIAPVNRWARGTHVTTWPMAGQQSLQLTLSVGYTIDSVYYELESIPLTFTDGPPGNVVLPSTSSCGNTYTVSWTNIDPVAEGGTDAVLGFQVGTDGVCVQPAGAPTFSEFYTIPDTQWASGNYSITWPTHTEPYCVQVSLLVDGNPGAITTRPEWFVLTYLLDCDQGGGEPGGGDPEGAWDQPEIDDLLARQAELVALAEGAEGDRAAIIAELQAIETVLSNLPSPMTATEFADIMGTNTTPIPNFTPDIGAAPYTAALGSKLGAPTMTSSAALESSFSVTFPLPGGNSTVVGIELNPDNWPAEQPYTAIDTARGVLRSLLVALIGVMLAARIWKALRQY